MAPQSHTYGPTCRLAGAVFSPASTGDDDIPPVKAQYFYSSPLPIDDPLAAVPPSSGTESQTAKYNPRPFSAYDNNALEEAWFGLASDNDKKNHRKPKISPPRTLTKTQAERRASVVCELATKHNKKHAKESFFGSSTAADQKKLKIETTQVGDDDRTTFPPPVTKASSQKNTSNIDAAKYAKDALGNHFNPRRKDLHNVLLDSTVPICCAELEQDIKAGHRKIFGGVFKRRETKFEHDNLIRDVMDESRLQREGKSAFMAKADKNDSKEARNTADHAPAQGDAAHDISLGDAAHDISLGDAAHDISECDQARSGGHSKMQKPDVTPMAVGEPLKNAVEKEHQGKEHKPSERHHRSKEHQEVQKILESDLTMQASEHSVDNSHLDLLSVPGNPDTGTTGSPFVRVSTRAPSPGSDSRPPTPSTAGHVDLDEESAPEDYSGNLPGATHRAQLAESDSVHAHKCKAYKTSKAEADVPVGISRLHLVKLPALQMLPIYWSPVHDIAAVTRATWFYKDTMYPVEAALANQLEVGYRELRPWSQTWSDELNSAIEVGAAGEEKISHKLWPKEIDQKSSGTQDFERFCVPSDSTCAARCFGGAASATGTVEVTRPDEKTSEIAVTPKRFPNSHVIYKDSENAFILKPNLQPSEYHGRRPLAKIKRGTSVGLHVVRGFDWKAWDKLHPSKKSTAARRAEAVAPVAGNADAGQRTACSACREQEERPRVTDLVLVIHGIGQKLSERVESFHFTHAINAFRRSVNIELGNEAVQNVLRQELGGVMVLPVNWRLNLSFDPKVSDFSLKDITPETIPAVRSVISEVVMDVPYYMSNHRGAMNEALVTESNRVYRLWCKNNPGFHENGRVHVIAHSLGSAMAMDVLSRQPTSLGRFDPLDKKTSTKHFEFDTKNLFFAGSPAGLFLLLDKSRLVPRKGRSKPGADHIDGNGKEVTGEGGAFGCLAVDNLYNIIHQNDPIACRLNATVDSLYASSLKNATIPSATTGWLGAIGNAVRAIAPGAAPSTSDLSVGQVHKPPVARLPSQLEMEVHDFTREEIAEKKFYLLNDNGQIDYFLSSGGGPLEIQYLNMLSAHSSYWASPDFVRMVVIEIGRKPGRSNALPNMKAVKKSMQK